MLSKKRKMMIGAVLVVGILITSIWAWNLWKSEEKEEEIRPILPIPVAMDVDSENNVHIAFQFGHYIPSNEGGSSGYYIKLNENGEVLIKKGFLFNTVGLGPMSPTSLVVDDMGCIHILFGNNYFKLDNNGTVLLNNSLPFQSHAQSVIRADGTGNIHILTKSEGVYYLKLNTSGGIETQKEITNASGGLSLEVDSSNSVHLFLTSNTSYIKLGENGTILTERCLEVYPKATVIDSQGNLYICGWWMDYKKIDNNGTVLVNGKEFTRETNYSSMFPSISLNSAEKEVYITWVEGYNHALLWTKLDLNGSVIVSPTEVPILRCVNRTYMPVSTVDLDDDICLSFYGVEKNRKEGIYFMKLDREGNVIIPEIRIYGRN